MTSHSWHEIDRLLSGALDLPEEERAAFLKAEAAGDDALLRHVAVLLRAAEQPTGAFKEIVPSVAAGAAQSEASTQLGPYRLERRLGQGGMGLVYLATRELGDAQQRVALKIIRPELAALADSAALARFGQEQEVLAGLEHPHIARLLDAGKMDTGVPFLAMEYVPGEPITAYCESHALPLAGRLALMAQVARAVDYAHRRLIVHRDLKPGNVLVTQGADGQPVPKLLDFGIAKLIGGDARPDALITRTDARPLTPGYAAPEQLLGDPVTTATDVYALGVLLYELIVGRRPFEHATQSGLERAVLHDEPLRPSTQLHRTDPARATGTRIRSDSLRGDVDVICLKAISKEPERRYPSAAALADDLDRYLAGLPIEARPATLSYRTAKFVRRNRTAVFAAVAVGVALLGGTAAALWQAHEGGQGRYRAEVEALRAEQTVDFLVGLMELGDPFETDEQIPASALTDSGVVRIQRSQDLDPVLAADLLLTIGGVYKAQGRFVENEQVAASAIDILQAHPQEEEALARALSARALALWDLDRLEEAEPLARRAGALLKGRAGAEVDYASTAYRLAFILLSTDQAEQAVALTDEVLEEDLAEHWAGDRQHQIGILTVNAMALSALGRADEAVRVGGEAMRLAELWMEPESQSEQSTRHNYAVVLMDAGQYAEAEAQFRRVLAVEERQLAPDHPDLANTLFLLAELSLYAARPEQAAAYARRADVAYLRFYGPGGSRTLGVRTRGAAALFRMGEPDAALGALRWAEREAEGTAAPEDLVRLQFMRMQMGGTPEPSALAATLPEDEQAEVLRLLGVAEPAL